MNPREARFLASQAERLEGNKKQQNGIRLSVPDDGDAPELVNDDNAGIESIKEQGHQFFTNFRRICSEFQSQIDELLLMPSSSSLPVVTHGNGAAAPSNENISNRDDVKAYYATASRRNEGRIKLDAILRNVRSLQRHALSSSSSAALFASSEQNNDSNAAGNDVLQSVLKVPMPDLTPTDMRLISQEIDKILKRTDDAREIICPKEKFVFKRYRKAMEDMEMKGGSMDFTTSTYATEAKQTNGLAEEDGDAAKNQQDNLRSKYGGVLENMADCTIEISSDGSVLVNETPDDLLQYYSAPRPLHALHPPPRPNQGEHHQQPPAEQESSSYLLQNLQNVTLLLHGSRPSLHLQHIRSCRIYVSEPTLGAVHVTDCHSSEIRCSCYQLRVHESRDVKFDVWVRSGPIIEDSRGMVFEGNYYLEQDKSGVSNSDGGCGSAGSGVVGRNMFWDVKDFNWLRALRKSPNFTVITKSAGENGKQLGGEDSLEHVDARQSNVADNCVEEATVSHEEEDSEDEL